MCSSDLQSSPRRVGQSSKSCPFLVEGNLCRADVLQRWPCRGLCKSNPCGVDVEPCPSDVDWVGRALLDGQFRPLRSDFREWWEAYLRSYLERDLPWLGVNADPVFFRRLITMLAYAQGGVLNTASLGNSLAVSHHTVARHLDILEQTFLLRRLAPYFRNVGKRLVKTPKVLLGDTGLLCHLLGIDAARLRTDDLMTGPALENFVAAELAKQISWSETRPGLFHYRTHTQQEVDFVLEDARGRLVGIEVKKTASPTSGDFKGLRHLAEQTGKRFLRGVLLYTGSTSAAFETNLHAMPVSALWQLESAAQTPAA